jgi:hypothetical protein
LFIADSTLKGYNRLIAKFQRFCLDTGVDKFPPVLGARSSTVIAEFLCHVADLGERPESQLRIAVAALGHLYASYQLENPLPVDLRNLVIALVKSGTFKPLQRNKDMPCHKSTEMFLSWPENDM